MGEGDNIGYRGIVTQALAVFTGTFVAVSDGMHYGWSAPVTPILLGEDSPIKITKSQSEWLETILMIGAFCGLPVTIYLVDKIGRKNSILLATTVSLIIWIVIGIARQVEYILVARFFAGMMGDMAFVAAPMYIAEIADEKIRGFLSSLIYLMMLSGIILIYGVVPFVPFYVPSIIIGVPLVIELIVFPFMPDSPYYLITRNKMEKAEESLKRLRQKKNVDVELEAITAAVKRQNSERGRPWDIILVPSNRKALVIMTLLNGGQHFCCISVILMNLHSILDEAGGAYMDSSKSAIIFSLVLFVGAITAMISIDKFGRKLLLGTSCILTGFCLLAIAIFFTMKNGGTDTSRVSWIPIVSVMFYAVCFKFGVGMVPIVMTAELFPSKVKAVGMTLADAMYVIFSIASLEMYHPLAKYYGLQVPFFIFAGFSFFMAAFTYFMIPETKGKTLEEIQFMLKGEPYAPKEEKDYLNTTHA